MKPLQLRIAGLHSYLDEQTIDFAELCGLGVFGLRRTDGILFK